MHNRIKTYNKKNIFHWYPFGNCLPGTELLQSIVEETLTSDEYVPNFNFKDVFMKF